MENLVKPVVKKKRKKRRYADILRGGQTVPMDPAKIDAAMEAARVAKFSRHKEQ